jgi:two-component system sensor histidine kinase TctE
MNDLLARLASALSAQQRFTADAAHQLRTPLAGIKTQAELALRQDRLDDVQHTLRQLNTATGQTTHLINQLLSLARSEPAVSRAQATQRINLHELCARYYDGVGAARTRAPTSILDLYGSALPATIEGDAVLVRELLSNLLDNAIRYTQPGGQVTVRVAIADSAVTLSVEDNGPGIPPAERERVFERFHRVLATAARLRIGGFPSCVRSRKAMAPKRASPPEKTQWNRGDS